MSKYVTKKHGMIIGSDNVFFYYDDKIEKFHDFSAIVSVRSYYFDKYSSAHCEIETPAQQYMFNKIETEHEVKISDISFTETKTHYEFKIFIENWLNENCPGWGFPKSTKNDSCIFFKKKKSCSCIY